MKSKGVIWVRFEVEVERQSQRVRSRRALGSGFDLSLGAISLAGAWLARGVCSLPLSSSSISLSLSSLSVFRKMVFEGKIKTEIILHPNTRSTEKHFRKIYFPCATKHPHLRKSIFGSDFHPNKNTALITSTQSRVPNNTKIHQPKVEMQEKKSTKK